MATEKNTNTPPATTPETTPATAPENTTPETAPDIVADDATDTLELTTDVFGKINLARDIAGGGKGYCTMVAENRQAMAIQCANESTGAIVNVPRVVLIDKTGKGYQAVSVGVYNAVKRIVSMFGNPATWDTPVTVVPQNVDLGGGQHTFNLIVQG